jgi:hypothetical protein
LPTSWALLPIPLCGSRGRQVSLANRPARSARKASINSSTNRRCSLTTDSCGPFEAICFGAIDTTGLRAGPACPRKFHPDRRCAVRQEQGPALEPDPVPSLWCWSRKSTRIREHCLPERDQETRISSLWAPLRPPWPRLAGAGRWERGPRQHNHGTARNRAGKGISAPIAES